MEGERGKKPKSLVLKVGFSHHHSIAVSITKFCQNGTKIAIQKTSIPLDILHGHSIAHLDCFFYNLFQNDTVFYDFLLRIHDSPHAQCRKVGWGTPSLRPASRALISPACHCATNCSKPMGRGLAGCPKRTPRAFAAAIPSAWRCRIKVRSVSAI